MVNAIMLSAQPSAKHLMQLIIWDDKWNPQLTGANWSNLWMHLLALHVPSLEIVHHHRCVIKSKTQVLWQSKYGLLRSCAAAHLTQQVHSYDLSYLRFSVADTTSGGSTITGRHRRRRGCCEPVDRLFLCVQGVSGPPYSAVAKALPL